MPRLTLLLLVLGLLALHNPAGSVLHSMSDLLFSDSVAPDSPPAPEPSPDSGWEFDPNG
jgi:hypothetical protein